MRSLQKTSKTVLSLQILFLLLLGFSFLNLEPGTSSYVAAQVALVPVVLTLVLTLAVIAKDWDPFK